MSGSTDLPLSPTGRAEAELVAARLEAERAAEVVYSSPLSRALDTAEAIARRLGTVPRLVDGLREIDCGLVDGLPLEEVQARFPDAWQRNLRQEDPAFRWPGGESYLQFRDRCVDAIRDLAVRHHGQRIVVVTHAGVISQLLGHIQSITPSRWSAHRPANASITEVSWRGDRGVVIRFDDRRHLAASRRASECRPAARS